MTSVSEDLLIRSSGKADNYISMNGEGKELASQCCAFCLLLRA